jgi:hypothetical protein
VGFTSWEARDLLIYRAAVGDNLQDLVVCIELHFVGLSRSLEECACWSWSDAREVCCTMRFDSAFQHSLAGAGTKTQSPVTRHGHGQAYMYALNHTFSLDLQFPVLWR